LKHDDALNKSGNLFTYFNGVSLGCECESNSNGNITCDASNGQFYTGTNPKLWGTNPCKPTNEEGKDYYETELVAGNWLNTHGYPKHLLVKYMFGFEFSCPPDQSWCISGQTHTFINTLSAMVQNKPNPWSYFLTVPHDQIYKVVENFYLSYLCSYGTAVGDVSTHQKIFNINGTELPRYGSMNLHHFDRTKRQEDLDDIIGDEIVVKGCTSLTDEC